MIYDCFKKAFVAAVGVLVIGVWAPAFADSLKIADEIKLLAATSSSDTNSIDSTVKTAEKEAEYRIGRIEVRGNWLIFAETIKRVIKTKEGEVYDREQLVKDLRSIYNLGYFESKGLKVIPRLHGAKVDILFCVSEAPVLQGVSFLGSPQIIDAELKSVIGDFVGWPVAQWRLDAGVRKIQELCIARGIEHWRVSSTKAKYVSDPEFYAFNSRDKIAGSGLAGQAPVLMRTVLHSPMQSTDDYTLVLRIDGQPNSSMKPASSAGRTITLPADGRLFRRSSDLEIWPIRFRKNPWPKGP